MCVFRAILMIAQCYAGDVCADSMLVDPWFNFRATKYLIKHGFYNFWDWFDDR